MPFGSTDVSDRKGAGGLMIFIGDDWAEDHHDVYLMDAAGARLASRRLPEGLAGIGRLHQLVAGHVEQPDEVVIGIETDRGLWVDALTAAGYRVYAINPLVVARYRDRHHLSGAKSDAGDAKLLADLVRTDRHNHRPLAGDSPGPAPGTPTRCARRCGSTTRRPWSPSTIWPIETRWRYWAAARPRPRVPG